MIPCPLFLSPSDDLHGPPFQQSSASAIEYMDSYEESKKCKDGAKIQFNRRLCTLCKDGARLFAQIKACVVHRAQSFALRSL
jgi:hypothetical protein